MVTVLASTLGLISLSGCPTGNGDECPDGSPRESVPAVAEACTDIFECGPEVTLAAATGPDDFAPIADGSAQPVFYGSQGGYHLNVAAEMHNLCPVVFLDFALEIDRGAGERETIQSLDRHVQTVRCSQQEDLFVEGCNEESTQQRWWALQLAIPCDYHPDDPEARELNCDAPPVEHIEDLDIVLRVEAWDHSEQADPDKARRVSTEVPVEAVCCSS
jgi:hypothetical protein